MHNTKRNLSKSRSNKSDEPWLAMSLRPEIFIPGAIIGFLFGLFVDFSFSSRGASKDTSSIPPALSRKQSESLSSGATGEELKMVLVVRQDLKMGAGKIASQCAHAATGLYAELMQRLYLLTVLIIEKSVSPETVGAIRPSKNCCIMQEPARDGFTEQIFHFNIRRLLLKGKLGYSGDGYSRNKLKEMADRCGLPTFVVSDAGRTQVRSGSRTVLAIGPGRKADVDSVTGKLRLL